MQATWNWVGFLPAFSWAFADRTAQVPRHIVASCKAVRRDRWDRPTILSVKSLGGLFVFMIKNPDKQACPSYSGISTHCLRPNALEVAPGGRKGNSRARASPSKGAPNSET